MTVTKTQRILMQLAQLEQLMQDLALWQEQCPSQEALASIQPFAVDTLTATEWLQWIFIPKLRQLVEQQSPLPTQIAITPYLEESCKELAGLSELLQVIKVIESTLIE